MNENIMFSAEAIPVLILFFFIQMYSGISTLIPLAAVHFFLPRFVV